MRKVKTIPATNFCSTLAVNVDNEKLSDSAFRELCRNSLPIVSQTKEEDLDYQKLLQEKLELERKLKEIDRGITNIANGFGGLGIS